MLKALSLSLYGATAAPLDQWINEDNGTVYQGDDGRFYVQVSSMQYLLPMLPGNYRDVVPYRFVPGDESIGVATSTLPSRDIRGVVRSLLEQQVDGEGGEGDVLAADEFISPTLREAVERAFLDNGCPTGEFYAMAYVCYDSKVLLVFRSTAGADDEDPSDLNTRLKDMLYLLCEEYVCARDLADGGSDAILVVYDCEDDKAGFCRPELIPTLLKAKDLVDPAAAAASPMSNSAEARESYMGVPAVAIVGTIGRMLKTAVSRMEAPEVVGRVPLQNLVMSMKQTLHALGINLRFMGRTRQVATHPSVRCALLCEMIARTTRKVLRTALRGVDLHSGIGVVREVLCRLFCLPKIGILSPDDDGDDPSAIASSGDVPTSDDWSHSTLKVRMPLCLFSSSRWPVNICDVKHLRCSYVQEALLMYFPGALTEAELGTGVLSHPRFAPGIRRQSSLWHSLSEEEQRVVLYQFQRLAGVQITYGFDPSNGELFVTEILFATR